MPKWIGPLNMIHTPSDCNTPYGNVDRDHPVHCPLCPCSRNSYSQPICDHPYAAFCQNWDTYIARKLVSCRFWWYFWNFYRAFGCEDTCGPIIASILQCEKRVIEMFPYTYSMFTVDRVSLSVTSLLRRVRFKRRSSDLPCLVYHSGHDNCFVCGE